MYAVSDRAASQCTAADRLAARSTREPMQTGGALMKADGNDARCRVYRRLRR
jgi:hypothetical protein